MNQCPPHRIRIETPNGSFRVEGVCLRCGMRRWYASSEQELGARDKGWHEAIVGPR